jgi:uncharacterized protein
MEDYNTPSYAETNLRDEARYITKVYAYMAGALAITALVSMAVLSSPTLLQFIFGSRFVFLGLIIAELVCVGALVAAIQRIPTTVAYAVFMGYAVLNGLTLSSVFLVYTSGSIASTFFITATTFGIMSTYGFFTNTDLTRIGNLAFMALIGIILASLVNFFLNSPILYWVTTYIGILVFVALIAYDTQKIKAMYQAGYTQGEMEGKGAIMGALSLYLDFINLFLMLLRLFGRRN